MKRIQCTSLEKSGHKEKGKGYQRVELKGDLREGESLRVPQS